MVGGSHGCCFTTVGSLIPRMVLPPMDLAEQLRWTQIGLTLAFCAVLILVCGWLAEEKVEGVLNGRKRQADETCKLHMRPRSQCRPEEHEETK